MPTSAVPEWIRVDAILEPRHPMREHPEADLDGLVSSMEQHGQLQPIRVRPMPDGKYEPVYGHRRWLACKKAGKEVILADVQEITDVEAAVLQVVENHERMNVSALESARALDRLRQCSGFTEVQVSKATGMPLTTVSELLSILELPADILKRYRPRPSREAGQHTSGGQSAPNSGDVGRLVPEKPTSVEQIDREEASYNYKHLVAFAKLRRSSGLGREEGLRRLADKVLKHRLSKAETEAIVAFLRSPDSVRLPDDVRELLLSSPKMTAEHAKLLVDPVGRLRPDARKAIGQFTQSDRKRLAKQVHDDGLSVKDMCVRIEELLKRRARGTQTDEPSAGDSRAGAAERVEHDRVTGAPGIVVRASESAKFIIGKGNELKEILAQPQNVPLRLIEELTAQFRILRAVLEDLPIEPAVATPSAAEGIDASQASGGNGQQNQEV